MAHSRQGWIARPGIQFGTNFVLYRRHPALAHSEFCVLVMPLNGDGTTLGLHDVGITNRLCGQVGKTLLLMYVVEAPGSDRSSLGWLEGISVSSRPFGGVRRAAHVHGS